MAEDKIKIDLEVKNSLSAQTENLYNRYKTNFNENSVEGATFRSSYKNLKGFLSENDLTSFRNEFEKFSNLIKQTIQNTTSEVDKLNNQLLSLQKQRNKLEAENAKTISGLTTTSKGGYAVQATPELFKKWANSSDNRKQFLQYDFNALKQAYTSSGAPSNYTSLSTIKAYKDIDPNFTLKNAKEVGGFFSPYNKDPYSVGGQSQAVNEKLSENSEKIKDLTSQIELLNDRISTLNPSLSNYNAANEQVSGLIASGEKKQAEEKAASQPIADVDNGKQLTGLGKLISAWTLYRIGINTAKKALREAVTTIKDLDKYLTEQAMVTGKTREQTYSLLQSYQDLAIQLGSTTKEVSEVATQYMRQGKTTEEALTLTEAAVSAAKVAGISASDSVNYLTTALNGFQLSAEDAMSVSDKFAAIAANSATSYEEIATALSKVASQANLAGMSIDYTTALLAKGIETTREAPETIGTALKTVIARMREISDYGETLAGDTDVNNVETQLAYVGIALKNTNGELRSTEDVLDDLGKKWDTLNTNQQAAIAKALAGTRQQSRLIAMMTDYERTVELEQIAQRSSGATMAQMSTYLTGMDAALNKLNTSWEKIISSFTDSDLVIAIINGISSMIDALNDNMWLIHTSLIAIISLGALGLVQKTAELDVQRAITRNYLEQQIAQQENNIQQAMTNSELGIDVGLQKIKLGLMKSQAKVQALSLSQIALIVAAITTVLAVTVAIVHAVKQGDQTITKATDKVSELSSEIYNLNQSATSIQSAIDNFEELDNKVIKTTQDIEDMNTALSGAADALDSDQQEEYSSLTTDRARIEYLRKVLAEQQTQITQDRQTQLKQIAIDPAKMLEEATNLDALLAINNQTMYDYLDTLDLSSSASSAVQSFTQTILENLDSITAWTYTTGDGIAKLVDQVKDAYIEIDGEQVYSGDILGSSGYTIEEQLDAYRQLSSLLSYNQDMLSSFKSQWSSQYDIFESMDSSVIKFIDDLGISIDDVSDMFEAYDKLQKSGITQITEEQYKERIPQLLQSLATNGGDIGSAINSVFNDVMSNFESGTEEYEDAWNAFIEVFNSSINETIEDVGSNFDSLTNNIENVYSTILKWADMTETEKAEFITSNPWTTQAGALEAIQKGDFDTIRDILLNDSTLQNQYNQLLNQYRQQLKNEEAKLGDERDEAAITTLKQYIKTLENMDKVFSASLENQISLEEKELEAYKNILDEEKEALQDSLNDRKDAYDKYFEAINNEAEDEDYDEQASLLINNLSKISSSTDASARKQAKEFEQSLQDLNDERQQTLRERAQQAVLDSIEDEVSYIGKQFDKLLDNSNLMIQYMSGLSGGEIVARTIASDVSQGSTVASINSALSSLSGIGLDTNNISISNIDSTNRAVTINIGGSEQTITYDSESTLAKSLIALLQQFGYGG